MGRAKRAVQGCICIPGVGQLPSRIVQCCTGIQWVGQLPSRTVQDFFFYARGRAANEQNSTGLGCVAISSVKSKPNSALHFVFD